MVCAAGCTPPRMKTYSFPQAGSCIYLATPPLLLLLFVEAAFYTCHRSHQPCIQPPARQQIGSVSQGRDEAVQGWHSRLVVGNYLRFHFRAALPLTCADSSVRSPLEGVGMWLPACSPISTKTGSFSDFLSFGLF